MTRDMVATQSTSSATHLVPPFGQEHPTRVLLVDDNEAVFLWLKREFIKAGLSDRYDMAYAISYDDGMAMARSETYDVCLLDYRLGGKLGTTFVQELRDSAIKLPAIMLTSTDDVAVDKEAIAVGSADYLVKSEVSGSSVDRAIRHAIEREQFKRQRERMIAALTHDLKTPVIGTISLLEQLQQGDYGDLSDTVSFLHNEILNAQKTNLRLIENILMAYKSDQGQLLLHNEPISIESLLKGVFAEELQSQARQKKVTVTFNHGHQDIKIKGDALHLRRVFYNLLQNAIYYTQRGGAVVINTAQTDKNVMVDVMDEGKGIAEKDRPFLFDAFHTTSYNGTGLGLYVANSIVKQHGGNLVLAKTSAEKGSTFTVTLPIGL